MILEVGCGLALIDAVWALKKGVSAMQSQLRTLELWALISES
jgi:hypothetical protein